MLLDTNLQSRSISAHFWACFRSCSRCRWRLGSPEQAGACSIAVSGGWLRRGSAGLGGSGFCAAVARCMLHGGCHIRCAACCRLRVACSMLCVVCSMLRVACRFSLRLQATAPDSARADGAARPLQPLPSLPAPLASAAKRPHDPDLWSAIARIESRLELDAQKEMEREALDRAWQQTIESLHASQSHAELRFRRRNQWTARLLAAPAEVRGCSPALPRLRLRLVCARRSSAAVGVGVQRLVLQLARVLLLRRDVATRVHAANCCSTLQRCAPRDSSVLWSGHRSGATDARRAERVDAAHHKLVGFGECRHCYHACACRVFHVARRCRCRVDVAHPGLVGCVAREARMARTVDPAEHACVVRRTPGRCTEYVPQNMRAAGPCTPGL